MSWFILQNCANLVQMQLVARSLRSEVGYNGFSATKDHRTKLKQRHCNKQFVDQHHSKVSFPWIWFYHQICARKLPIATRTYVRTRNLHDHTTPLRLRPHDFRDHSHFFRYWRRIFQLIPLSLALVSIVELLQAISAGMLAMWRVITQIRSHAV